MGRGSREQKAGSREQGSGQGAGSREQGTECREQGEGEGEGSREGEQGAGRGSSTEQELIYTCHVP